MTSHDLSVTKEDYLSRYKCHISLPTSNDGMSYIYRMRLGKSVFTPVEHFNLQSYIVTVVLARPFVCYYDLGSIETSIATCTIGLPSRRIRCYRKHPGTVSKPSLKCRLLLYTPTSID